MKDFKIDLSMYDGKVRELVSEAVQIKAFELGYGWINEGKKETFTNSPYLFFNKTSSITRLNAEDVRYFEDHRNTEISASDFLALTPEDVRDNPKEPEFKPFDKVLVRDCDHQMWLPQFYSHRDENLAFINRTLANVGYHQCIPYEGNEHLLGTTESPK